MTGRGLCERIVSTVVDVVFPRRCAGCERRGEWVCAECLAALPLAALPLAVPPWCDRCGEAHCQCDRLPAVLGAVRAVGPYDGWLRSAILAFKYEGETARTEHLGDLLAGTLASVESPDILVPVPLHRRRLRERGYDQADLLARRVARVTGIPTVRALVRTRATAQQARLGAGDRAGNVAGAFAAAAGTQLQGARIVLVDDVYTTGSTAAACGEAALAAGASWVGAVVLARGG